MLSAYFVAYALVLLPAGALVDRYGARRLALWGLAVFALCFTPQPILIPWAEFLEPFRRALHL